MFLRADLVRRPTQTGWLVFTVIVSAGFGLGLVGLFFPEVSAETPPASEILWFYLSPEGNDGWSGKVPAHQAATSDGPWRSLAPLIKVLQEISPEGPPLKIHVECLAGRYEFQRPFILDGVSKGRKLQVEISAANPGNVLWSGGRLITDWTPAHKTDKLSDLLPAESRNHVFIADLKSLGITDYGTAGGGGIELFYRGRRMPLARWPNQGFVKIANVLGEEPVDVRGVRGDKVGKFVYDGDRPSRWLKEKDAWVHGYWFWDWSDQRHPIESIDPSRSLITVKPPYHHYGYRKGQWWYAYNLLSELDAPGEWYLDRESGLLYFWPPDNASDTGALLAAHPTVSLLPQILQCRNITDLRIVGITMAHTRGTAVTFENAQNCVIENCEITLAGGWAVQIRGGQRCAVRSCRLHNLGEGGVVALGGDRATLSPAGHVVENNDIHDYGQIHPMYRAGVIISGVGQSVLHNHIHHAPHQAVSFSGNNHLIAWNEINHVCLESNDAGAIYAGRDWTMRGTVITCNYFHDISGFENRGCMGVYLDDMWCGTHITKNIFYRVTRAAFIGGGRDNLVENNVFIECRPAVHVDARAMGWASYHVPSTMTERLKAVPYQSDLWQKAYPELVRILEDEPAAPKGNLIRNNLCFGGVWENIEAKARPYISIESNVVLPLEATQQFFANPNDRDWRWRDDAPKDALPPGFELIRFERMGPLGMTIGGVRARPVAYSSEKTVQGPKRWETAIQKFEQEDQQVPPPPNAVLFVGSSSIVRWNLSKFFPNHKTINRGFGGSQIHEVTYYVKRIVAPYRPRIIVFYAGDNDIAAGASPQEVLQRFKEFVKTVRAEGIDAPIIFIGIKPSLARWQLIDKMRLANKLIREFCQKEVTNKLVFVDVEKAMLGPDGKPRPELFVQDGLHLSDSGYEVWTKLLEPVIASLEKELAPSAGHP